MIQKLFTNLKRPFNAVTALLLALSAIAPVVLVGTSSAAAGSQVTNRSITMSNSTANATGVSYTVQFTPVNTTATSLIVDVCAESPIPGATCTTPTSFSMASATLTTGTNTTNWTLGSAAAGTFKITKGTGSALPASATSFTIVGVHNPNIATCNQGSNNVSPNCSFYARIYTYACTDYGTSCTGATAYSSPTSVGSDLDYGGFALDTNSVISISATVQETLVFCVSKLQPGSSCGASGQVPTTPSLTLGNGGNPNVLDTTTRTDTAWTAMSTNALNGVSVNMKAFKADGVTTAACNGLSRDGGTTCDITGLNAYGSITGGTFGVKVANSQADASCASPSGHVCAVNNQFGLTAGGGTNYNMSTANSAGGVQIMTASAPCTDQTNQLTFAAQAAATTPAGVYSANEDLIATGTF